MHLDRASAAEMTELRASYAYVPARLVIAGHGAATPLIAVGTRRLVPETPEAGGWTTREGRARYSSVDLDHFHQRLLLSDEDADIMHGLLSVVFWGNVSGADIRIRQGFALSRARMLLEGRRLGSGKRSDPTPQGEAIDRLRAARRLLREENQPGSALREVMQISFLRMSFASKVLTFMDPTRAAVYDSIIERLLKSDPSIDRAMICDPGTAGGLPHKESAYVAWCTFCSTKAAWLNGQSNGWKDWDGTTHPWRAVDAERAIFALGMR